MDTGRSLVVPTVSAVNGAHIETLLINALTGTHLKPVGGYSSPDRKLALMSGEADGVVGSIDTFADLVASNVLLPVLRLNDAGPDAPFAVAPILRSFATGPDADLLVALIETVAHADRILIAPNALPAEQVEALEQLFDAITGNPNFGKGATFAPSQVTPGNHAEIQQRVGGLLAQQGLGDALARALACGGALSAGQTCV